MKSKKLKQMVVLGAVLALASFAAWANGEGGSCTGNEPWWMWEYWYCRLA